MNNSTLYQTQTNAFTRGVHIGLMGDPTLRMDVVTPASSLSAVRTSTAVNLNWSASPDSIAGYHLYRSGTATGPFTRLTTSLIDGTSFADSSAPPGATTYMLRAVKLEINPSGSYFNGSQGIFASVAATSGGIRVSVVRSGSSVILTWNSQAGTTYHALAKDNVAQPTWTAVSGSITATGATTSWSGNVTSPRQRFFKISSP